MILVVSYDEDHTVEVVRQLDAAGHEVVRVDLAHFPAHAGVTLRYGNGGQSHHELTTAAGATGLDGCRVAWWRRARPFTVEHTLSAARDREFAASETAQALHGMFHSLTCAWVNPPACDGAAHHKPYQWDVARRLGLALPHTLVTNEPEQALGFIRETGLGRTVFKAFLARADAWRETRLVRPEDLAHLETVRYAPVIFQEFVPGVDLRVTVVGDRVFAAEIDASATSYPVDMRMVLDEAAVRRGTLPPSLTDTLLRFMRRLGLVYGAIDLRRRPDGEYVFLEVNPAGQWLFVEERTGLPITAEVAGLLSRLDRLDHEPVAAPRHLAGSTG
ncbi:MvdC/MvdD family ATP grasp protein [Streptomyces sp. NPDC006872]|uniref:MvdC/MvdD family ATP grasp protein n=1 Tax=Streptomyces sp. NPDC006872 TaxID=3155720 RepID=UPI0033FB9D25